MQAFTLSRFQFLLRPGVREELTVIGLTLVAETPEWFARTLKGDYEKYGKLIRTIGLQPQ